MYASSQMASFQLYANVLLAPSTALTFLADRHSVLINLCCFMSPLHIGLMSVFFYTVRWMCVAIASSGFNVCMYMCVQYRVCVHDAQRETVAVMC